MQAGFWDYLIKSQASIILIRAASKQTQLLPLLMGRFGAKEMIQNIQVSNVSLHTSMT